MGRLTNEQKAKIVRLREQNANITQIVKILGDDDCKISRLSVRRFLKRFQERQSFANAPQPGRPNEELTAPKLRKMLQEQFGVDFSDSKVKRLRQKLGWVQTGTKYCQLICEANWVKRLEFCMKCLEDNEQFDDVIFTDECSVHMEKHAKLCFRRRWEQPKLKGRAKHPFKVHIWAGISKRGATRVLIFSGNMDAMFYVNEILEKTLLPFINSRFPDGHRFQQDNDPKHTSRLAQEFMTRSGINWWKTPPETGVLSGTAPQIIRSSVLNSAGWELN